MKEITMQATKLHVINENGLTASQEVESLITQFKSLKHEEKIIQAKLETLKKQLIKDYFIHSDTIVTDYGLVLGTYKSQIRIQFDTTRFKYDNADLYDSYCEPKEIKTLIIK